MDYFPMFVDIRGLRCVVIGGGGVAARKAEALLRAGAQLHLVGAELCAAVRAIVARPGVTHRVGAYLAEDLDGARVVIAATDDTAVNLCVSRDARARGAWVNVVDQPSLSTFIVPSLIDRSPIVIAVSSGGAAPVLARSLRGKLEAFVPPGYDSLAQVCASLRGDVKAALPDLGARRAFWETALESQAAEHALRGEVAQAEQEMRALLDDARRADATARAGDVVCIGAGPGDPDLVSFRAQRALLRAAAVFHTEDVPAAILDLCRRDAPRRVLAGRFPEALIACVETLVASTRRSQEVSVLVPGDGFRSEPGERALAALRSAGLRAVVVPGIAAR